MGKNIAAMVSLMFLIFGTASAGAAPAGPLDQIVEGAKKEGTVSVKLRTGLIPKSMQRLEKEIRQRFGADLDIKLTPTDRMAQDLAEAIMEYKAGAAPSYDLMTFSSHVTQAMKAGILEKVDWKPLITKETNPEVILEYPLLRGAIIYFTGTQGLMYNPEKVPESAVPKRLSDLADPKWKGRIGTMNSTDAWARWAFYLGKEEVLARIRGMVKNKAIQGRYADLLNRYLLGEISMCLTTSAYLKEAQDKGMPSQWRCLDIADIQDFSAVVTKGAKHPNAAKLVALYLASPEGARFVLEESGAGNIYYPGNYEHDIRLKNKALGISERSPQREVKTLEFLESDEFLRWMKEIKAAFDEAAG